ncbi:hypothetical protein EF879_05565 [Micromonospora sp. HM5-17]|nr:hypothetical protein EF879_05565 [Micromonospora sp. HM5-17]
MVAGCLLATAAPGAPAQAITPPITVTMSSSGAGTPRYEIRIHNDTDGIVKTTVRQELPAGAIPASVSEGGQTVPSSDGRPNTEVVWQVQLGGRATAVLNTTLTGPPPGATTVTAPACAYVANGSTPYDCATATWPPGGGGGGSGAGTAAGAADSPPWWRGGPVRGAAAGLLVLLAVAGAVLWVRRLRRRRVAAETNRPSPAGPRDPGPERRIIRRVGWPIVRATARVRGDAKIPAPASVRAATGHRNNAGLGPDGLPVPDVRPGVAAAPDGVPGPAGGTAPESGLVGIAGGARYVGRAPIPPQNPVPGLDTEAADEPDEDVPAARPVEESAAPSPAIGRAPKPRTSPPIRGVRRRRPPAWVAVGTAALLAVALATITAWTGTSQVNAISSRQQPSSGAWIGRTVAGPVGTALRDSAFEFTVYRLTCPPGPVGCQAIVGVRNITDKSQQWYGQLQRAYLPGGDWVTADVPATQVANAGEDPFAAPVPAGRRMLVPLVFARTGSTPPTRIELRSAVFSAGVSVAVPR